MQPTDNNFDLNCCFTLKAQLQTTDSVTGQLKQLVFKINGRQNAHKMLTKCSQMLTKFGNGLISKFRKNLFSFRQEFAKLVNLTCQIRIFGNLAFLKIEKA